MEVEKACPGPGGLGYVWEPSQMVMTGPEGRDVSPGLQEESELNTRPSFGSTRRPLQQLNA